MSSAAYIPLRTVQAFIPTGTTMPSADSSRPVRTNHSVLSLGAKTDERPPEVSSTAFSARPPDLQSSALDGYGLRESMLARPTRTASYLVLVHRPTLLLHAAFRPRLTTTPWRFAMTSPPSGCQRDFHPQAVEHARRTWFFGPFSERKGSRLLERIPASPSGHSNRHPLQTHRSQANYKLAFTGGVQFN